MEGFLLGGLRGMPIVPTRGPRGSVGCGASAQTQIGFQTFLPLPELRARRRLQSGKEPGIE